MSSENEAAERHFMDLAMQYHVAGRSAAFCQLVPVAANLLHHSIELILKALLVPDLGLKGVFKLNHRLINIWDATVARHPSLDTADRRQTIHNLDQFERLRYPDDVIKNGAGIRLGWDRQPQMSFSPADSPQYELVIADTDELFRAAFQTTGKNPQFFAGRLNKEARAILGDRNNYPWIN